MRISVSHSSSPLPVGNGFFVVGELMTRPWEATMRSTIDRKTRTLNEASSAFLEAKTTAGASPKTIHNYSAVLGRFQTCTGDIDGRTG